MMSPLFSRSAPLLVVFCLFGLVTDAQSLFEDHPVRHIGPGTMSGRVTALDVDPTDRDIIYAGTASGGLWRSTSSGAEGIELIALSLAHPRDLPVL